MTNQGTGPTNGTVNVTEIVPTGMTLASMAGSGWNCTSNTCARSDVLSVGCGLSSDHCGRECLCECAFTRDESSQRGRRRLSVSDWYRHDGNRSQLGTCATLPSGNESALSGQYAGRRPGWQGSTPSAMAFSVALDGAGNVKDLGGGIGGDLDVNDSSNGPRHFTILSAGSFYTVGPDPGSAVFRLRVHSGFVGCLQLQTSVGSFMFAIAPGSFTSGIATKGALLQINSTTNPKSQVAGQLQTPGFNAFGSATRQRSTKLCIR